MKVNISLKTLSCVALLFMVLVLLAGLSSWNARKSAEKFLGQTITSQMPYFHSGLALHVSRSEENDVFQPRWIIRFGTAFSEGLDVEVSLLGKILACNVQAFDELIMLPEKERIEGINEIIQRGKSEGLKGQSSSVN